MAWGALFIWWGITELVPGLPHGTGAIGIGLILLGLNVARSLNGVPTSGFTMTLGILALVLGGLELAISVLRLPIELPVFAILLIVLGVILLARELLRSRNE
jgi:hydrogenase/urease accessory protein HupE